MYQSCSENRERLELIQAQIEEIDGRLGKLSDAIETGDLKNMELSPRIKALSQRKQELLQAKANAEEILRYESVDMADPQVVKEYTDDLRNLLAKSSITEQRSFLKSFVERIEADESEAKVYYTIPMPSLCLRRVSPKKPWEFYLSYTTVEGEGDKGGEGDQL